MRKRAWSDKKKKKQARRRESIRRVMIILREPITWKDRRGFSAEDKAEKALSYLKKKKIIANSQRTERYGSDDLAGVDFIVELLTGKILKINVKNYRWYWKDEKESREKDIELLTIWESDSEEIALKKMLIMIISAHLSNLKIEKVREIISAALKEKMKPPRGLASRILAWIKRHKKSGARP